jgi:branched-chain amino acid transport system permease protein
LELGGVAIPFPRLLSFFVAMLFALTLHLFLLKTTYGTAIRGTGQDPEAAHLMGINVNKIYALSFGLGISCNAVAATLLSTYFPLSPFLGASFMVITFIVIVLGGLGNYMGAFIAGLILGTIEVLTAYMLSPLLRQTIPLVIFILVLLLKPEGLFGRKLHR